MSADVVASTSSPVKEQPITQMETSTTEAESAPANEEQTPMDSTEEATVTSKASKRKRSAKEPTATEETSTINTRPRRTLPKKEEPPVAAVNGSAKSNKTKAKRSSTEHADADDEQERDKNIPILHDVADVVWVKIGGHPWWPSLVIRDPNDETHSFTKVVGTVRPKRSYFVAFYGSTADFAWVTDSAVIPYQGVEAFTKYAQEVVDKAQTKSQKEQLTERFQLKVTIGRREDWEMAVREADDSVKQTSEKRLQQIEPKVEFFTSKMNPSRGQSGRKSKASAAKSEDTSESTGVATSSIDPNDRSALAEKTFEFKSEDESSDNESSLRKSGAKLKLRQQASDEVDAAVTPPAKRRNVRKSEKQTESSSPIDHYESGSSASRSQRKSEKANETSTADNKASSKSKSRGRISKPSVVASNGNVEKTETTSETSATKSSAAPKSTITKPQAFTNTSQPASSLNNILIGQHHRFDTRIGFLSPFEEQEILDAIEHLRSKKTFEEVEQIAKQRFEQILSLNLNKTRVEIPPEWFYSFLFAHPILIVKNPHWFDDKKASTSLVDDDLLNEVNRTQTASSVHVLKHQLSILSKLYHNELQIRQNK